MRASITVRGVVQGVGYRFFVLKQARLYNVNGFVRNMPDGTVQVVAEGTKGVLNEFIEQLRIGPVSAHVTGMEVEWSEEENRISGFRLER